jgi:hypothetical protein
MGRSFQQIGKDMEDGKTKGDKWYLTKSVKKMHHQLFGKNCKFNGKLGKKHQNQLSSDLGDGYFNPNNEDSEGESFDDGNNLEKDDIINNEDSEDGIIDLTNSTDSDDEPGKNDGDEGKNGNNDNNTNDNDSNGNISGHDVRNI